ncbi:MAG: hypothetical protein R3F20_04375 [Planctomycetota bacterium]
MTGSRDEKRPAGSARAKLEAFERTQRASSRVWRRVFVLFGFLAVLMVAFGVFKCRSEQEGRWFDAYKDLPWQAREGRWDEVKDWFAPDLVIEGVDVDGRDALLELARAYGPKGLPVFATHPHKFGEQGDVRWFRSHVIWARGNDENLKVTPLVRSWLIEARLRRNEDRWQIDRLNVRPEIAAPAPGERPEIPEEGR